MITTVTDIDLDTGYKLADCEVIEELSADIEWSLDVTESAHKATTSIRVHRIDFCYTSVMSTQLHAATHEDEAEWHDDRETVTMAAINGNNGWIIEADEFETLIGGDVFPIRLQIEIGDKKAWVTF